MTANRNRSTLLASMSAVALASAASAQPTSSIDQISAQPRVVVAAPASPPSIELPPQLTSKQESGPASRQLTSERRSAAPSAQVYKGQRSAQPSAPLSKPGDGRTAAVERVEGQDGCDPAASKQRRSTNCAQAIETRASQFARQEPAPLSPEQRILIEQRLRERPAGVSGTARRLATRGSDADTSEGQEIASIVLRKPPEPPPEKKPEEDAVAADQAAAIVSAIVNQPPN